MRSLAPIIELVGAVRPRPAPITTPLLRCGVRTTAVGREESEERRKARERAWYLSDPTPSSSSSSPSNRNPSSRPSPPSNSCPRASAAQPRFTTWNPHSTTSSASDLPIVPLPSSAPKHFTALHSFLTTHPEVIIPHSVKFLHPPSASSARSADVQEVIRTAGEGTKGRYDWIVIATVAGRGKGVVARAERMVRLWLADNPISPLNTPRSRTTKLDQDTDWSVIPVGSSDSRTAVNLFTEEGLERWDLESLWAPSSPKA